MEFHGICNSCLVELEPIWYTEEQEKLDLDFKSYVKTGKTRIAISHLICPCCLKNVAVDGEYCADK